MHLCPQTSLKRENPSHARLGYPNGALGRQRPRFKVARAAKASLIRITHFLIKLIDLDVDITMPELAGALADATGVQAHPDAIGRFLRKLGFTYKKVAGRYRATPRKGKKAARLLVQTSLASGLDPTGSRCLH